MQLDKSLLFSDAQNLAQAAGTYLSDKSVDLWSGNATMPTDVQGGTPLNDPGRSGQARILCQVTTAFTSAGAATVQAQLIMADDAALTSNVVVLESSDTIAKATLVAGYAFRFGTLPPGITKRFLGMQYVIGTATTTAGNITSAIVVDRDTNVI